jgi:hypothetical protein
MATIENPPVILPEKINLPDGRSVALADILGKMTNVVNINVRTGRTGRHISMGPPKMPLEERRFRALASLEDIQARYECTAEKARNMKWSARKQLGIPLRAKLAST